MATIKFSEFDAGNINVADTLQGYQAGVWVVLDGS